MPEELKQTEGKVIQAVGRGGAWMGPQAVGTYHKSWVLAAVPLLGISMQALLQDQVWYSG